MHIIIRLCDVNLSKIELKSTTTTLTKHITKGSTEHKTLSYTHHICVCLPAALLLLLHEHLEQDIRVNATHASSATSVVMVVAVVVPVSCVRIVQVLQLHALVVSINA